MHRRLTRILLVALAVAALATAGIVANFVLLGYADSRTDPVGKLTPRANISQPTPPAPNRTTTQEHTETEVQEPDD
jgi:hypothetical protein